MLIRSWMTPFDLFNFIIETCQFIVSFLQNSVNDVVLNLFSNASRWAIWWLNF